MRTSKEKLRKSRKKKVVGLNTVLDRAAMKQDRLLKARRLADQIDAQSKAAGITFKKVTQDVAKLLGEGVNDRSSRPSRNRH